MAYNDGFQRTVINFVVFCKSSPSCVPSPVFSSIYLFLHTMSDTSSTLTAHYFCLYGWFVYDKRCKNNNIKLL